MAEKDENEDEPWDAQKAQKEYEDRERQQYDAYQKQQELEREQLRKEYEAEAAQRKAEDELRQKEWENSPEGRYEKEQAQRKARILKQAKALAAQAKFCEAMVTLNPTDNITMVQDEALYIEYKEAARSQFWREMVAAVGKGSNAQCQQVMARYKKRLGPLRGETSTWVQWYTLFNREGIKPGRAVLLVAKVEGVLSNGVLVDHNGERLFVRSSRPLGVVDGDTLAVGAVGAGPFAYTNVMGGRSTVRSVNVKAVFDLYH